MMIKNIFISIFVLTFILPSYSQLDNKHLCSRAKKPYKIFDDIELRKDDAQSFYDIYYYDLKMDVRLSSKTIAGENTVYCTVLADKLDEVHLDLSNSLSVTKVTFQGKNVRYKHKDDILIIFLNETLPQGRKFDFTVFYEGTPGHSFHFQYIDELPLIWTLSEPYGSKEWWPCKNLPYDKADSMDFSITVPANMIAVSNGVLISVDTLENDRLTYHWKERYPIVSYLVSIAIHPYKVITYYYHYNENDSMPVTNYIFPGRFDANSPKYKVTTSMLEAFSSLFGQYPFIKEKYGHAEFTWGGGMEHQTVTSLIGPYEYLIAHELAHQWWGDMITCKDFHHIWLNEGFATYSEALWAEHKGGSYSLHTVMRNKRYLGEGSVYVEDISEEGRIFSGALSYNKASWVLHMLRHVTGDSVFFKILKEYGDSDLKYGVATTEDFKRICEDVSGMDLTAFFDQWIYGNFHPVYLYDWNYELNDEIYVVNLTVEQFQVSELYQMPIDVTIVTEDGEKTFKIENNQKFQSYEFTLNSKPLELYIDKDDWILCEKQRGIEMANHDNNNMILTIVSSGSLGFNEPDGQGNGLIFPAGGINNLYFGSLMFRNAVDYVADNSEKNPHNDFIPADSKGIAINATNLGDLDFNIEYNDAGHPESKNISVNQTSYSWSDFSKGNFIFFKYNIKNNGDSTLNNFYAGQFLDLDMGYYLENKIDIDSTRHAIYQYNRDSIHVGIVFLNKNQDSLTVYSGILDAIDQLDEDKKYAYLSGTKNDFARDKEGDWASVLAAGPFILEPGDSLVLNFAIVGGVNKDDFINNAGKAIEVYDDLISGTKDGIAVEKYRVKAFPNPFGDDFELQFDLEKTQFVTISLYDMKGQKVYHAKNKYFPGTNVVKINKNLKEGLYFYKINFENGSIAGKVVKHHSE